MKPVMSAAEIRAVFGKNLIALADREKSAADLARKLGLNRTQLHRFMDGSAFPRPDVLAVICTYFGVDARILTTPLADFQKLRAERAAGLDELFDDIFVGLPDEMLPDGDYLEWMADLSFAGMVSCYSLQVFTDRERKFMRIFVPDFVPQITTLDPEIGADHMFVGQVFPQLGGFAVLDRTASQKQLALTAYRVGYSFYSDIYPGYKLAGASYIPKLVHAHAACILQRLPTAKAVAAAKELPIMRPFSEAPPNIQTVLNELNRENHSFLWPNAAQENSAS